MGSCEWATARARVGGDDRTCVALTAAEKHGGALPPQMRCRMVATDRRASGGLRNREIGARLLGDRRLRGVLGKHGAQLFANDLSKEFLKGHSRLE
jgi:hypothetical protein